MPVSTSLSDEDLMLRVQADDLDQLTPLFERYHGPLFGFLTRLNHGDQEIGQDLTQNVFLRVLKYRASFRAGLRFRTWLYQLARHVHADHWQQRRPAPPTSTTWSTPRPTAAPPRLTSRPPIAPSRCRRR
ncbi:hypothetical protein MUN84_08530 [Hymenobacter sp. 5516J-16]|uniref:RNA polymerase sigma factor n=1 Tax=Hymenobacter sp. 5516J-16 TaxID=2932253 RepID=UPI001FD2B095|nr:sigma factor [Hymenobacter sp. 5516J-16]UOQ78575.1 hypothetical protein MUN84_08530 [Hymenobacter sp. 5516J-16]